jgi:hypothetical protein
MRIEPAAAGSATAAPRIAVIAGALGYRQVLSAYLRSAWPAAEIEEIDPFSQTMRGAGIVFGAEADVMLVAGLGTLTEAINALERLGVGPRAPEELAAAHEHAPAKRVAPVILLASQDLALHAQTLIEAGAAAVLLKDALSRESLISVIERIVAGQRPAMASLLVHTNSGNEEQFGLFKFSVEHERVMLPIEHFKPLATLAANPMAQVFLAERLTDGKRVVVKFPLSTPYHETGVARQFCDRYLYLCALDGRHVVRYLDAGIAGSWPYVVLEYLAAGDLRQRMATGITTNMALRVLAQIGEALATLHAGGFAHMDIKPENIFFRADGSLALIDFNISTAFGRVARNRLTGDVLGSPFYMSPEQGRGAPVDGRSDLYSAGVILFEMLTGERPYAGENSAQVIFRHLHDEIPLLPRRIRDLQPLVDQLLAKDAAERFATAEDLLAALRPFVATVGLTRDAGETN